jgi:hypothetical protein
MKTSILVGVICLLFAGSVWASCRSNTIVTPDGKVVICTICCNQGQCTTVCY